MASAGLEQRVRRLETEHERQHRALREDLSVPAHSLCASDSNSLAMRRQARLQDAVKFLVQEVRQGKLRPRLGRAHSPPAARQPRPSAATESEEDVAQLRRYRELEQRGEELAATVEARLAESDERVKVEMDWYGKVISQRLDEQRKWFEEYRVSAQLHGSLRRDSGSDRGQEESQREEAVGGGSDAALFGRRLLQLEERLELLEHDSLLLLIEELRTDTRRQLRAEKKGRRAEANRQQQLVEALQSELQQQRDRAETALSALEISLEQQLKGSDAHMLRRTSELAAVIDEFVDEGRQGSRTGLGGPPEVEVLRQQVSVLAAELQATRAEVAAMRGGGASGGEVSALRAEIQGLEAVCREALRLQEAELVALRKLLT